MTDHEQSKLKRLRDELKIIPWWSYAVAAALVALLAFTLGAWYLTKLGQAWGDHHFMMSAIPLVVVTVLWIWFVMIFYVVRDARRRRMNVALWTLLVIIIPNALGFIVYFLLREPIPARCTKCSASLRPEFAFCPTCGESRVPTCPGCRHPIEPAWTNCAFCGKELAGKT